MTPQQHPARDSELILTEAPPPADQRLAYGPDPNQFGDLRLPKASSAHKSAKPPVLMFIHGGYWRAKYGLDHTGHICAALSATGFATWNTEYRRVGNPGGAWPGTFEDLQSSLRFLHQLARKNGFDEKRILIAGHSAGGQLALALAAHQRRMVHAAVSLAGVLDLRRAYQLHLSNDAVVWFMGGTPQQMPDHYREADPMELNISVPQLVVHGTADDTVPFDFSKDYVEKEKREGEHVTFLALQGAGHFTLIDPQSEAWPAIQKAIGRLI